MTPAGKLDRRIQFRRATDAQGPFGQEETWADHGEPVWAAYAPVRDSEKATAGQVQATAMARFTVRWSQATAGVNAKDRLVFEGREWAVIGAKELGRREWVELTAVSGAD